MQYLDGSSQLVIMKAKPARTCAKITQQTSGRLKYTYVRTELGAWTRIEKGRRIDEWVDVDKEKYDTMIIFVVDPTSK